MLPWLGQSPGGAASVTLPAAGGTENSITQRGEVQGGECRERPRKSPHECPQEDGTERSEFVAIAVDRDGCLSRQLQPKEGGANQGLALKIAVRRRMRESKPDNGGWPQPFRDVFIISSFNTSGARSGPPVCQQMSVAIVRQTGTLSLALS
jgi:hypothetical protein